jgi:hypothetical protein
MSNYKYLTEEQKEQIVKLSHTHYPREIARIVGCTSRTVMNLQKGMENPKRKFRYVRKQGETFSTPEGYFNIEAWAKEMAF